ncbi:hypothetical protein EKD04_019295 [Chloroflexales bacterium ZM16-3]|nr:hypothetical protein [Chloroflexales bacterium ZM16-3]
MRRIDLRTLGVMLIALAVGLAWAAYNLTQAGLVRDESTVRPLVWAVFAAPAALFVGWLIARRREMGMAAACCFCLYFFSFFVAQRIESLAVSPEQVATYVHSFYFWTVLVLHAIVGVGMAIWRAQSLDVPGRA